MSADCAILNSREKIMLFEIKGGNMAIKYIFFIIGSYLLGSANTSCILGSAHGHDPRHIMRARPIWAIFSARKPALS